MTSFGSRAVPVVLSLTVLAVLPSGAAAAAPSDLASLRLTYRDEAVTEFLTASVTTGGNWDTHTISVSNDAVVLRVRLTPPAVSLPVEPDAATLFTRVTVEGGAGEIALERSGAVRTSAVHRCHSRCTYRARVRISLGEVRYLFQAIGVDLKSPQLEIAMTFVRSFDREGWFQVVGAEPTYDSRATLGNPDLKGTFWAEGLVSAAQHQRDLHEWKRAGGTPQDWLPQFQRATGTNRTGGHSLVYVPLRIDATVGGCSFYAIADVHDTALDRVYSTYVTNRSSVHVTLDVPAGRLWYLTVHVDSWGVPDPGNATYGPFVTYSPALLGGTITCNHDNPIAIHLALTADDAGPMSQSAAICLGMGATNRAAIDVRASAIARRPCLA